MNLNVCRLCSSVEEEVSRAELSALEITSSGVVQAVQEYFHVQLNPKSDRICHHCLRFLRKLKIFADHCRRVQRMFQMAAEQSSGKVSTDWDEIRTICEIDNFTWKVVEHSNADDQPMPDFTITPKILEPVVEVEQEIIVDEDIHFLDDNGEEITFTPQYIVLDGPASDPAMDSPETHFPKEDSNPLAKEPQVEISVNNIKNIIPRKSRERKSEKSPAPFECPECGKILASRASFKTHKQSHGGGKSFACEICVKKFVRSDVLWNHMLTHTGQRKFECDVCDKTFYRAADLRSHQKIHDDAKPFSCTECDKQFKRAGDLRSHNLTHERKQSFQCGICHKQLLSMSGLKYHLKVHSGDKPYECTKCDQRFRQAGNLRKHFTKVHPS